jgi:hypothetical protein
MDAELPGEWTDAGPPSFRETTIPGWVVVKCGMVGRLTDSVDGSASALMKDNWLQLP